MTKQVEQRLAGVQERIEGLEKAVQEKATETGQKIGAMCEEMISIGQYLAKLEGHLDQGITGSKPITARLGEGMGYVTGMRSGPQTFEEIHIAYSIRTGPDQTTSGTLKIEMTERDPTTVAISSSHMSKQDPVLFAQKLVREKVGKQAPETGIYGAAFETIKQGHAVLLEGLAQKEKAAQEQLAAIEAIQI